MTIECRECGEIFGNLISWKHLKKHELTTSQYKNKYGDDSTMTLEFRNSIIERNSGENNPNFGNNMSEETKKEMSDKLQGRVPWNKGLTGLPAPERGFKPGDIPWNKGIPMREDSKDKLRLSDEEIQNRQIIKYHKRVQRTLDLEKQKEETNKKWLEIISSKGFIVLNEFDRNHYKLQCNKDGCNHIFETTQQNFHDSKYETDFCQFCPMADGSSRAQKELFDWLKATNDDLEIQWENKSVIWPKEIDIYIPALKLGIEYCGLYWHSEKNGVDREYHKNKFLLCESKGIKLIQIFEDEWLNNKEIVKSMITSQLKKNFKIFARKTIIEEIPATIARKFLTETHIGGPGKAKHYFACLYKNEIVSVMSFSKGNLSRKNMNTWEIERFATKLNYTVVGAAGKLLSAFIKKYNVEQIISYADIRYGTGGVYERIGFIKDKHTVPNYWYFKSNTKRYHRFSLRKNDQDDQSLTEWQNRKNQGWNKIYDAGSNKYIMYVQR